MSINQKCVFCLWISLFSSSTFAFENQHKNTFELNANRARINTNESAEVSRIYEDKSIHLAARYLYNLSDSISLGIGYLIGDDVQDVYLYDYAPDHFEYRAYILNARYWIPISGITHLYIDLGAHSYETKLVVDDRVLIGRDGYDYSLEVGWALKWRNGMGMKIGYQYLRMGDYNSLGGIDAGISFSF